MTMKIVKEYSYFGGSEILQVHFPLIDKEISFVISSIHPKTETDGRISLYTLFSKFQSHFQNHRFVRNKINYSVPLLNRQAQFEDTFVQIDFFKEKVMVEVKFAEYPFMLYDMVKFQYFFNERKADVGV